MGEGVEIDACADFGMAEVVERRPGKSTRSEHSGYSNRKATVAL